MTDPSRVGAVVLAGGRSARFGRDKLAEPIAGRAMLDRAIDAASGLAPQVIVVAAPGSPGIRPRVDAGGIRVVTDPTAFEGPLAGLATGLRALDATVDRAIVVGGDMPTLVVAVLDRLLAELDRHDLAVLADDERPRPLPLAAHRWVALAAADRLLVTGERRLRALFDEVDVVAIPPAVWRIDDPDGRTLLDVDTPDDLPRAIDG